MNERDCLHTKVLKTEDKENRLKFRFDAFIEYDHDPNELDAETNDKIDRGDLVCFVAKVSAWKAGICLGEDYLGGCIYEDYEDFYENENEDYVCDMIENSRKQALETLKDLMK